MAIKFEDDKRDSTKTWKAPAPPAPEAPPAGGGQVNGPAVDKPAKKPKRR